MAKPTEKIGGWGGTEVEPSASKKLTGWIVEKLPFQYLNWFWNKCALWIDYFFDVPFNTQGTNNDIFEIFSTSVTKRDATESTIVINSNSSNLPAGVGNIVRNMTPGSGSLLTYGNNNDISQSSVISTGSEADNNNIRLHNAVNADIRTSSKCTIENSEDQIISNAENVTVLSNTVSHLESSDNTLVTENFRALGQTRITEKMVDEVISQQSTGIVGSDDQKLFANRVVSGSATIHYFLEGTGWRDSNNPSYSIAGGALDAGGKGIYDRAVLMTVPNTSMTFPYIYNANANNIISFWAKIDNPTSLVATSDIMNISSNLSNLFEIRYQNGYFFVAYPGTTTAWKRIELKTDVYNHFYIALDSANNRWCFVLNGEFVGFFATTITGSSFYVEFGKNSKQSYTSAITMRVCEMAIFTYPYFSGDISDNLLPRFLMAGSLDYGASAYVLILNKTLKVRSYWLTPSFTGFTEEPKLLNVINYQYFLVEYPLNYLHENGIKRPLSVGIYAEKITQE